MANKKPLVFISGVAGQLQTGDVVDYLREVTVAYSSKIALNSDNGDLIVVGALTANANIGFTGTRTRVRVKFTQDVTGGRSLTWDASVTYNAGTTFIEVDPAPSAVTILLFVYNSTSAKYDLLINSYNNSTALALSRYITVRADLLWF